MKNPVLERELVGFLRTRRALAMQIGVAVLLATLVLIRWPSDARADLSGAQARQVFHLFGVGLAATVLLLVPAFPATSLVSERRRGTLALLLHTPLKPWTIYLGKLGAALGFILLPLAMSVPAAAACYAIGGLSLEGDLLALYLVMIIASLQLAALSLWISSFAQSADSALRITYGLVFVLTVVTLGPYQFLQGKSWDSLVTAALWLRSVSLIPAVLEILGHADVGSQGLSVQAGAPLRFVMMALAMTGYFSVHTMLRLHPGIFDRSRPRGVLTEERSRIHQWFRRLLFIVDPQRRSRVIGPWMNPVLIKEFRSRKFGRSHWMLRLIALCAVTSLGLTYTSTSGTMDWGVEAIAGIMVILQAALIILLTPGLAAGLISSERESGGWILLQMTPMSSGKILRGKLLSVAWTVLLILLATLPGYLVMVSIQPSLTQQVTYVVVSLLLLALFAVLLSASVGSLFRRAAPATVMAYALLVGFCGGTLLVWLGRDTMIGHEMVESLLAWNPIAAALSIMEVPGFSQYELIPAAWWNISISASGFLLLLLVQTHRLTRPR